MEHTDKPSIPQGDIDAIPIIPHGDYHVDTPIKPALKLHVDTPAAHINTHVDTIDKSHGDVSLIPAVNIHYDIPAVAGGLTHGIHTDIGDNTHGDAHGDINEHIDGHWDGENFIDNGRQGDELLVVGLTVAGNPIHNDIHQDVPKLFGNHLDMTPISQGYGELG